MGHLRSCNSPKAARILRLDVVGSRGTPPWLVLRLNLKRFGLSGSSNFHMRSIANVLKPERHFVPQHPWVKGQCFRGGGRFLSSNANGFGEVFEGGEVPDICCVLSFPTLI